MAFSLLTSQSRLISGPFRCLAVPEVGLTVADHPLISHNSDLPCALYLAFRSRSFLALISGCPLSQMGAKILKSLDRSALWSALFSAILSGYGLKRTGPLLGSFYDNF